jgi:acyl-CoA reductase-like NAD-dependent aldehyde dehydrogenase
MVRAFVEAGVPDDVFINVFLDHGTTSALISEGLFNFVNFTGSVEGGPRHRARRGRHLHRPRA